VGTGAGKDGGCVNAQEDAGEDDGCTQRHRTNNMITMLRLLLLTVPLLALTGCRDRHEWHQKLTLVVQTPAGEVSGSAVVAVTALFGNIPATGTEVEYSLQGEATVVEVAPGRYLFALVPGSEERFYAAAQDRFDGMQRGEWLAEIPRQREAVSLLPDAVPMLVTFADVADPASVALVDPIDLAATFGPGVALTGVWLEITDERVTEGGVVAVLGWLCELKATRTRLNGQSGPVATNDLSDRLGSGSFKIGVCK
jgi:hypothetical protein